MMGITIGMPAPTMEMSGLKSFRTDSEELFVRWLTNGEASNLVILLQPVFDTVWPLV
ncbi:UNVERIFIED_CONTAM: protein CYCLOPS [Sesamum radiatum]|uniref:Protein CYCLOPS n=1 Tax=Sesamum radiatum TaxID=300843 RepID=A0AAW2L0M7_SESRA